MAGPFTFPVSGAVPFDGTETVDGTPVTPPFTSENARDGIIEARDTAVGLGRFVINLTYNGTVNNSTFIGYLNTIPGDSTPILLPVDCELTEFTFSNQRANADYTLEFRINTTTGTPFFSVSKTNTQFFTENAISQLFAPGDQVYVKYVDDGQNALDVVILLFFKNTI